MAVATPIDAAVNPNDTDQRYILWSNGRIDAVGGAPPVTDNVTWYTRFEPPAVAIHVTDWTTGSGYVLEYRGGFHPFGGAPALGDSSTPERVSGITYSAKPNIRLYVDWSWDPAGTGQGYVLDLWGQLLPFGGATAPPRTGRRFPSPRARRLEMRWTPDKRAVTIDMQGRMYADFTGSAPSRPSSLGTIGAGVVRDFAITDWTTRSGHILEKTGRTHAFGSASDAYGYPYRAGGDVARVLKVLSASDPAELWQVWAGGQQYEYVSSTAPTVTAGGDDPVSPADTVTDTTRPMLAWDYSDPQGDSQAAWQLLVFTQAFVDGHSMSNPLLWTADALVAVEGIDRGARGITCPVDLPDGDYRMYVRAQDTSGLWSAWDDHGWTQDAPEPATPTGLTATADPDTFSVALTASVLAGGVADLVRFEYSDDDEETWATVRGAGAVPMVTAADELRRNLVTNPSFETGTTDWTTGGSAVTRITSWQEVGTAAAQITPSGSTSDSYIQTTIAVEAGQAYTFSATGRVPTAHVGTLDATRARRVVVYWMNASNVAIGSAPSATQVANTTGAETRISLTATAPVGAVNVLLRLYNGSNNASDLMQWDGVLVEAGSSLGTYFDGDTADSGTEGYSWTGSSHASESIATSMDPIDVESTDWDVPLGVDRAYRARSYAVDPAVVSSPSNVDSAGIAALTYVVTAVDDPTLGGEFRVQEPVEWTRPVRTGEFQGLGAEYVTVVKDGVPKGKRTTLHVFTDSLAAWQRLEALAESGSTLVYRDPFGEVRYCEIIGDWSAALMSGAAERHLHDTDLPLVEVAPPDAG